MSEEVFIYAKDMAEEIAWLRNHVAALQIQVERAHFTTERTIQLAESFKSMLADMHAKHATLTEYLLEVYGLEWR